MAANSDSDDVVPTRSWTTLLLGLLFIIEVGAAVYVLVAVWPDVVKVPSLSAGSGASTAGAQTATAALGTVWIFGFEWTKPTADALYIVAVVTLGALGSSVQALTSFGTYVGNHALRTRWVWWYLVRLPIGAVIALIIYLVLRGGLLSVSTSARDISPYGIGAVAALSGMFSRQATDKLRELFETLFHTTSDANAQRKDKLSPS